MLIYSHKITARLRYTAEVLFKHIYHLPKIEYTDNIDNFNSAQGAKIAYAMRNTGSGFFIKSSGLLHETSVKVQHLDKVEFNGLPAFFGTNGENFPFDFFSATFYLISRYEEYLPFTQDEFGRFQHTESILHELNLLQKPIVNIWADALVEKLKLQFPQMEIEPPMYKYTCTIDIDNAFAYKDKGAARILGGFAKDLANFKMKQVQQRFNVLINREKDPFDTYLFQLKMIKKYGFRPLYFFLLGDYGFNDKNIPFRSTEFQSLIKLIADYSDVGIHPSYGSNSHSERLSTEIKRLKTITKRNIENSRQHFLKLSFPNTYRRLIENDIKNDYTMGYSAVCGFRAGICSAYPFYDLEIEKQMPLMIHPFAVMESTFQYYMKLNAEQSFTHISNIINEVKKVNGHLITLWHNESLGDQPPWEYWAAVFEKTIAMAVKK